MGGKPIFDYTVLALIRKGLPEVDMGLFCEVWLMTTMSLPQTPTPPVPGRMKHFQPKGQGPEMEPELPHEPDLTALAWRPSGQGPLLQGQRHLQEAAQSTRLPFLSALFHKLLLKA